MIYKRTLFVCVLPIELRSFNFPHWKGGERELAGYCFEASLKAGIFSCVFVRLELNGGLLFSSRGEILVCRAVFVLEYRADHWRIFCSMLNYTQSFDCAEEGLCLFFVLALDGPRVPAFEQITVISVL